jgi:hypothetical protein
MHKFSKSILEKAKEQNEALLGGKFKNGEYVEAYLAAEKTCAEALLDLAQFNLKAVFSTWRI